MDQQEGIKMISRRQIIESQQKLNAQRYLLEKKQQQENRSKNTTNMLTKAQSIRQQVLMKMTPEEGSTENKSSSKIRQLMNVKKGRQLSVEKEYDIKMSRFNNKCFHDDNYAHEEIDDDDEEDEDDEENDYDDDDDKQFVQDLRHGNDVFDPYSLFEDEEEDVWYSEERLFEVSKPTVSSSLFK